MNLNAPESGIASTLASRGRRGDSMLVHMAPEEVKGLQALALAHGGSLTINPQTGLYEANILKKILPTIIGAVVPSIPGLGSLAKTIGFGNATLGTGLLVGGATALIEGDLKKGLEAGLGAYSGANITQSLRAASAAANAAASQAPAIGAEELKKLQELPKIAEQVGGTTSAPQLATSKIKELTDPLAGKALPELLKNNSLAEVATNKLPTLQQPSVMGGIKSLFTSPESRTAFGEALGGGFKSPFMQNMSKNLTFMGALNAMTPEPPKVPTGGALGEDYIYIPGEFNPLYGTGRDQPYQLPGKYYKRTPKGLVPFDPFALAPGVRGFADGGFVDPNRDSGGNFLTMPPWDIETLRRSIRPPHGDPGGNILLPPPPKTPFSPYFTNPVADPNVAATRAYIEDLNRRAKNPEVFTYPGMGSTGLGGTNEPYVPGPSTGGGGGGGGGGGAGSVVGGIIANDLINRGIGKGVDVIKDKLATDERAEIGNRPVEVTKVPATNVAPATISAASGVASLVPPSGRTGKITIDEEGLNNDPNAPESRPNYRTSNTSMPAAIGAGVMGGGAMLLPTAGRTGQVLIEGIETVGDAIGSSVANSAGAGAGVGGAGGAAGAGGASGTSTGIFGLEKGAPLTGKAAIIPGLQTALGLHQAYEGIRKGNEVQSALGGFGAATGAASLMGYSSLAALGPIGLAAAAVAALGSSMVNTKEYGDKALENYWKAVDQGRGFGKAPPEELAQGFINFFRTNKNEFPGQAKYGRTGNEDFVYDMTQVINNAVKEGKVDKGADASTIYEKVVQPWLSEMGPGPKNEDARKIQDFMMTDMIYNFMRGAPISNAQVKGDKKFKIVSEKPTYAGTPPSDMQMQGQMSAGFQGRPDELRGIGRDEFRTPFSAPEEREFTMPTPFSEPKMGGQVIIPGEGGYYTDTTKRNFVPDRQIALPPEDDRVYAGGTPNFNESTGKYVGVPPPPKALPTPFSEPQAAAPPPPTPFSEPERAPAPYMPRIIDEEPAPPAPPPQPKVVPTPDNITPPPEREEIWPTESLPPPRTPFSEPEPTPYMPRIIDEEEEEPRPRKRTPKTGKAFNYGGAVGEDYNFGFAGGGMPGEYQAGGKLLDGPGDGMSDDIPAVIRGKGVQRAALADGEFVIPADVVSHLGNGSTKAGAKKLYDMMARVRKARTGKASQAPAVKTDRLLPV